MRRRREPWRLAGCGAGWSMWRRTCRWPERRPGELPRLEQVASPTSVSPSHFDDATLVITLVSPTIALSFSPSHYNTLSLAPPTITAVLYCTCPVILYLRNSSSESLHFDVALLILCVQEDVSLLRLENEQLREREQMLSRHLLEVESSKTSSLDSLRAELDRTRSTREQEKLELTQQLSEQHASMERQTAELQDVRTELARRDKKA